MTVITGDLILVTDRPSAVTEVWIRADEIRTHDGGLVLEDRDREPIHDGWLEINVLPGPAILTLVSHGKVRKAIPIVVPDAEATSLEDAVNAARLAQPSLKTWLEELAASILAGTKGPKGDRGPKGDPGPTGTLDLIDESAQTTIDTVVIPAIEDARDEALGQVEGAVATEIGNTTHVISAGTSVHAGKVVRLGETGKLHIGMGTVTNPTDPASKQYVDLAIGTKSSVGHKHNAGDIVNGTTQYVNYPDDRFADQIVRLDAEGRLHVTTEGITKPTDPVNKQYVDTAVNTAGSADLGATTHVISAGDATHAGKVVRLGETGKLHIGAGTVTDPTDPASKQYVDLAIGTKSSVGHTHIGSDIVNGTTRYVNYDDDRFANQLVRLDAAGKFHITTSGITALTDPVNKQYVDTAVSAGSPGSGQTMWWN